MEINLTKNASRELDNLYNENSKSNKKFRIMISGIGWGGPRFGIALDEQNDNDITKNIDNLDFVIDERLANEFQSFKIDYNNFFLNRGFHVYPEGSRTSFC